MAAARPEPETAGAERRLVDVVHQLLSDPGAPDASTDLTRRVLAASMTALDASSVRLVTEDDEVLADWRLPGFAPRARDLTTLSSRLPDGSALTVTWNGPATVTAEGLEVLAALLGMVEERTAADRHAALRLRQQRQAWGQEIHDGITQSVTAAVMMLERVKTLAVADASLLPTIEAAQEEIRSSLRSLRGVLAQVVEDDDGPDTAQSLAELVEDLRTRWRLQARIAVRGDLAGLTSDAAALARAVVREAIIDATRDTTASHITVTVTHERDGVRVVVADDRHDLGSRAREPRLELRMLEERVQRAKGTFTITIGRGGATTVEAVLPRTR